MFILLCSNNGNISQSVPTYLKYYYGPYFKVILGRALSRPRALWVLGLEECCI